MLIEIPISAVAPIIGDELVTTEGITDETVDEYKKTEKNILSELEYMRTENSKTFRLSDGTCMIAQYNMPVHYKDDNGKWADYDNSLSVTEQEVSVLETQPAVLDEATADSVAVANISEKTEITTNRRTEKKQMFKNYKSDTGISFSKEAASDNMVLVEKGDYKISWGYHDINAKSAKQKNEKKIRTGNDRFTVLDNLTSTVVYESAYDGVDIECITTPVGVKENIILNKKSATNKFVSTYDIGELRAEKLNDREIALYNADDEIEYYINALYMFDANNETSDSIVLNIVENSNGKLVVELVADEQWLNAKERVYPVTIDPSFKYNKGRGEIDGAYVDSQKPTEVFSYDGTNIRTPYLYAGSNDRFYSLLKMNELPKLNNGDMIVDVTVNLCMQNYDYSSAAYVGVYEVNSTWNQETVTWNTKPGCDSTLIDYCNMYSTVNSGYSYGSWNITKLAKEWYSGKDNYGVYFKMLSGSNGQIGCFYSPNYEGYSEMRPAFVITYLNNKGIESYWDYTSVDVGNVGTAYVNDYSGALTFELPITSTADPVLPASVSYYYNSYMAGKKYNKHAPYFGNGWRMNMQQTVLPSTEFGLTGDNATNYPYVYTDADGTEHYFYKTYENGVAKYYDEDGLKLELTISSSSGEKYKITDENKNKYYFHSTGLFNRFEDAYGNVQKVNYSGRTITKISDKTGNEIVLNRNESDYVTSIVDPSNRTTSFTYDSNNNITGVSYPDGRTATISYDEDGLITEVTDSDGYKVQFGYNDLKQVVSIKEYGTSGGLGQSMTFDRSTLNETKVYTNGADGVKDTDEVESSDDCITTYQYDNSGRTISTQTSTNDGSELGASSATYTSGSNIKTMNKVTKNHALGANTVNLLRNSNLEGTSSWTSGTWLGETTTTVAENSTTRYYGQKSLCLENTACSNGGAGSIYQNVTNLSPKTTYTLSGYVKVESITATATENYGALVGVAVENSDVPTDKCKSEYISEVTDTSINDGWRRVSVKFTTPENISQVRVHLALESAIGKVYFDGVQLEKSENASSYNFVQNSSMELYTDNKPDNWSNFSNITFTGNDGCVSTESQHGSTSFKIVGDVTKNKILCQEIPVSGVEEDTYILSAWAKTPTAVPIKDDIKFKITIQVHYSDGTYIIKDTPSFNTAVTSWQYLSTAFNLSDKTDTVKTPTKVKIFPNYSRQGNEAYFDNLQLIKEPAQSYTYDDKGNLVSVVDNAKQNSSMKYNADNKLTQYVDPKGYKYEYTYNNKGKMETAKTQRGATYTYGYDARGGVNKVTGTTAAGHLTESSQVITYPNSDSAEYTVKSTDQLKRESTSTYNSKTGVLKKVSDSIGNIEYTYNNPNDVLLSVSQGGSKVDYVYDEEHWKNLLGVMTGTTEYSFAYDAFGNRTSSNIGSNVIVTNDYNINNGSLQGVTYGNGYNETYTYDKYGNINKKYIRNSNDEENVLAYEGIADNTGTITKAIDRLNGLQYNYTYDSTNRLVSSTCTDTTNNSRIAMFEYDFDLNNNHTKFAALTKYGKSVTNYTYGKDNLPDTVTFNNGVKLTYAYDTLGRNNNITINTSNPISTKYTYWALESGGSTYRSNLIHTEKNTNFKYRYTYDARNNLTKIERGTGTDDSNLTYTTLEEYTYDELSQLTQVDYRTSNKRVKYTYDDGGNIELEQIYTVSGDTETLTKTNTYTYGDDNWGDKLTAYNSNNITYNITYDAIGNPKKYRNGFTFTWSNGKQLDTLTRGTTTASYKYDDSGLRISKTANGVEYTYLYQDGLLVQETRGEMILDYSYDENGRIRMGAYRKTASATPGYFYYALNSRGDVIGIYESDGDLYAEYTYDAWGNITSITNSSGDSIANYENMATRQPFRYRGYYYDTESGFYYVSSRYYDSVTHRFINADGISLVTASPTTLTDKNLYAYCDNNPITRADNGGEFWHIVAGAVIGGVISGTVEMIGQLASGKSFNELDWVSIGISAGAGALSGALTATGVGAVGQVIGNAAISMTSNALSQMHNKHLRKQQSFDTKQLLVETALGGISGAIAGPGASVSSNTCGQKSMVKLGYNTVKRTFSQSTPRAYLNEARKATKYYVKSTRSVTKGMFSARNGLSQLFSAVSNLFKRR